MKLKQLLSPAVLEWNLAHEHLPDEQLIKEFKKCAVDNENMINESVERNLDKINECIERGKNRSKSRLLLESEGERVDWSKFDDWEEDTPTESESTPTEETPIDDEELIDEKVILKNDVPEEDDTNVYTHIDTLFEFFEFEKLTKKKNTIYWNNCDVSKVKDMTALFAFTDMPNANLKSWDTSNVRHMEGMFYKSNFNNDSICEWNVTSCADFLRMFTFSDFNQDLKLWTPAYIEMYEYDSKGERVKNPDGTYKKIRVRAELPLIGAAADEKKERLQNRKFSKFRTMMKHVKENKSINKTMKHIVDYDTFINEGFGDFVKKGVKKVKSFFKSFTLKINNLVAMFNKKGEMIDASSPYTALNYISAGKVNGVTAFTKVENKYLNDNVPSVATIEESTEYYDVIDKNSIEYKNYQTMIEMINERHNKYGEMLNEADDRVGFSAKDGGIYDVEDIDSKRLKELLIEGIQNVPGYKGRARRGNSLLIWGAPGIGKTTIPKSIIKTWNETSEVNKKKALLVVQCGDLTVDGFSLPMPFKKSLADYLSERPMLRKELNISDEQLLSREISVSGEAVKTWVPCYKPTSDPVENKIRRAVANGHIVIDDEFNEETGEYDPIVTETTEGGIILFDEFLRANEQVFRILMQIFEDRAFMGHEIGDKWAIVACSNRPNDDKEAKTGFGATGPVVGTRVNQKNFIPSFDEWKVWAQKYGYFDQYTIKFLMQEVDTKTGEYSNWHTIRPDEYERGKSAWPTPRTWSKAMIDLQNFMDNNGYSSILEVPSDRIKSIFSGYIGVSMAEKYVGYINIQKKKGDKDVTFDPDKVLNDPKYVIPKGVKCAISIDELSKHINLLYDKNNLPTDEQMMNLFNALEARFDKDVDNHVKYFYITLYKKFDFMGDPNEFAYTHFPKFHEAITTKYGLTNPKLMMKFLS